MPTRPAQNALMAISAKKKGEKARIHAVKCPQRVLGWETHVTATRFVLRLPLLVVRNKSLLFNFDNYQKY